MEPDAGGPSVSRDRLVAAVRTVVDLLVRREYAAIEKMTSGDRLPAREIRNAVEAYGRRLVQPPETAWSTLDEVLVVDAAPPKHHVAFDLWTEEEGRSDLTIELWISAMPDGRLRTQILNLHTL